MRVYYGNGICLHFVMRLKKWIFQMQHEHWVQICNALILHIYALTWKYYSMFSNMCMGFIWIVTYKMVVQRVRWNGSNSIRLTFLWKIFRNTSNVFGQQYEYAWLFSVGTLPYILQVVFMKRGHIFEFMLCMGVIKFLHLLLFTNRVDLFSVVALFPCRFQCFADLKFKWLKNLFILSLNNLFSAFILLRTSFTSEI